MSELDSANLIETNSNSGVFNKLTQKIETPPLLKSVGNLSIARQMGVMLGLALSVAIGVGVVLWSQEKTYDTLYSGMGAEDLSETMRLVRDLGVDYKVDTVSGAILVPAEKVNKLKLKLAEQGLPRSQGTNTGYEILDKQVGFGTSKNIELMRFRRALEGEIAKTISAIQYVKSARVLLALPKQSVFVRKRKNPSASVIVSLYQGRQLEKGQVDAIIHLVASSVPMLEATQVTVVDQKGQMLSRDSASEGIYLSSKQFDYKKNLEEHLMQRIENILMPLVGREGIKAQISADVDFTVTEQTQEMFDPDTSVLRSEKVQDDTNLSSAIQGIPGALSNQPTLAGQASEQVNRKAGPLLGMPRSSHNTAARNFELDKTITHTRLATGVLRRLSVAVAIDYKKLMMNDGQVNMQPYPQEDINQFRELVVQAVGFDKSRGDQVTVSNVAFKVYDDEVEMLPVTPLWAQSWFVSVIKQLMAIFVVLFLMLGVMRPAMRKLLARDDEVKALLDVHAEANAMGGVVKVGDNGKPIAVPAHHNFSTPQKGSVTVVADDLLRLESPQGYEKRLAYIQQIIDKDSLVVSQVISEWLKSDGR